MKHPAPIDLDMLREVLTTRFAIVFGEIHVSDPRGELAAHATTTYTLL